MSFTKHILLDRTMQEEAHGIGFAPETSFLPSLEERAQIEREHSLQTALEGLQRMKDFWHSGDHAKRALAIKYCSDVQEWFLYLFHDSHFLSFGSDVGFDNPEPDWDNEARNANDRIWEVYHEAAF
jgi:hypothetical protein